MERRWTAGPTSLHSAQCCMKCCRAQPAFPGETAGDILAAVIRAEPDWSKLPADTPSGIRRLLRRCLEKDRNSAAAKPPETLGSKWTRRKANLQMDARVVPGASRRRGAVLHGLRHWQSLTLIAALALLLWAFRRVPSPPEMRLEINYALPRRIPCPLALLLNTGRRLFFS